MSLYGSEFLEKSFEDFQASMTLQKERKKAFGANGGIMCRCEKCKGIGFAQSEAMLDDKGYLKELKCPCGGRIKKCA